MRSEAVDNLETVLLEKELPDRIVRVGKEMTEQMGDTLISLLQDYKDDFAFGEVPSDHRASSERGVTS